MFLLACVCFTAVQCCSALLLVGSLRCFVEGAAPLSRTTQALLEVEFLLKIEFLLQVTLEVELKVL